LTRVLSEILAIAVNQHRVQPSWTSVTCPNVMSLSQPVRTNQSRETNSYSGLMASTTHTDGSLSFTPIRPKPQREKRKIDKRAARGSKGITTLGRRKVRGGAAILERRYGKRLLSFLTFTVPPLERELMIRVCAGLSEIVRQLRQNIARLLKAKGLDPDIVGVIEIQEDRFKRTGEPVPHIHLVVHGRKSVWKHWACSPSEFEDCYRRAFEAVVGVELDMRAACNTEQVKKSVVSYLGKYLSKGSKFLKEIRENCEGFPLPKAWHTISRKLSQAVKDETERAVFRASLSEISGWLENYKGGIWFKNFEIEEDGAILSIYGTVDWKAVDRFRRYILGCVSLRDSQNIGNQLTS